MSLSCNKPCLSTTSDRCVIYDGKDLACCGIKNGETYDVVTVKLADTLCAFIDTRVDLSCLLDGTCGNCNPTPQIPEAVQAIINYLCKLDSDSIKFEGDLDCLFSNSGSAKLLGKAIKYNVNSAGSKSNFSFDISDINSNLPTGYSVGNVTTKVSGTPKNGRSVLLDTDKTVGSTTLSYDRYPLKIETNVRYTTPNGTVDLVHKGTITTPVEKSFVHNFEVQDLTSTEYSSLTDVIEAIANQVCSNTNDIDSLKNIEISGCDKIDYNTTNIAQIVAIQASALCDHEDRIEDLEKVNVKDFTDECGERTLEKSYEDAFLYLSSEICKLKADLKSVKKDLEETKNRLSQCCASAGSGSSQELGSGSGGSTGGGCPNGRC